MGVLYAALFSLPVLATALDLLFGDPQRLPHPVRLIGFLLEYLEPRARAWGLPLRVAGGICVALTAGLSAGLVFLLVHIPLVGLLCAVYFAYAGLALGQLLKEGRKAAWLIESGDLAEARQAVGWLVSRDTTSMEADELRRTLAETLSENMSDGFVCPLFYLCIGGPVALWAYKAVSTMDSMWGYRTERYNELGWACARMDDVLAYIPARLTMLFLLIGGACMGLPWRLAWAHTGRDARQMESPNAGWPMAACAWLLGAGMGGTAVYFGVAKQKPQLGPREHPWSPEKLKNLFKLLLIAGIIDLFCLQLLFSLLSQ